MKKLISIFIIFVLSLLLISCKGYEIKIGILVYDKNDTFMKEYTDEIINKLDKSIKVELLYADRNQNIQNKQLIYLLEAKVNLIIINAVNRINSETIIKKSEKYQIPIIFINREPLVTLNDSNNSYYVGADSLQMGRLQASLVEDLLSIKNLDINNDSKIQTIILKGEQDHQDSEKRTSEVIKELKKLNIEIELLEINLSNWDRKTAYTNFDKLKEKYDNIELIISNNDDMALGVIDYFIEHNIVFNNIIGVDGTLEGIEAINNNLMFGTISNDYKQQTVIIKKLVDYLLFDIKVSDLNYDERFFLVEGSKIAKSS